MKLKKDLQEKFLSEISKLYKFGNDFNVNIFVGVEPNIKVFKAHSLVLRARSSYFREIYLYGIEELIDLLLASDELALIELVEYIQFRVTCMEIKESKISRPCYKERAINDDWGWKIGFGKGDLQIFLRECQQKDYDFSIFQGEFEIEEYEVLKLVTNICPKFIRQQANERYASIRESMFPLEEAAKQIVYIDTLINILSEQGFEFKQNIDGNHHLIDKIERKEFEICFLDNDSDSNNSEGEKDDNNYSDNDNGLVKEGINGFSKFPHEIMLNIMEYLNPTDIISLAMVNKKFRSHTSDNFLWRQILIREYGERAIQEEPRQTAIFRGYPGAFYKYRYFDCKVNDARELEFRNNNRIRQNQRAYDIEMTISSVPPGDYDILWRMRIEKSSCKPIVTFSTDIWLRKEQYEDYRYQVHTGINCHLESDDYFGSRKKNLKVDSVCLRPHISYDLIQNSAADEIYLTASDNHNNDILPDENRNDSVYNDNYLNTLSSICGNYYTNRRNDDERNDGRNYDGRNENKKERRRKTISKVISCSSNYLSE
ncbi:5789_t:CDS:10 [Diversispora eburnea]|uniref:5789_t:CDS:1 n=1 Tax=Diversispora eburnea TaxID=1213867 RepID=A0A9N8ZWV3_9GLOM|nr:5789_t:CDS:10 [Diversispora eburnea]